MEKLKTIKQERAITLVALILTTIVLLILAGVSISALTGGNSIITYATSAKESSQIAKEKEVLKLILLNHTLDNKEMGKEQLQNYLISYCGENKTEVEEILDGKKFIIKFKESSNCYTLENGIISERIKLQEVTNVKLNCINSNNELLKSINTIAISGNVELPQNIITEEGTEYVAENDIADVTSDEINAKYLLLCNDDKTLIFTQTADEYILGNGNELAIKAEYKDIEYILDVPEVYNNKNVNKISTFAFANTKVKKLILSNNASTISSNAFMDCSILEYIKFGNNYASMNSRGETFNRCYKLTKNSFALNEGNMAFKIVDGVLYSYDLSEIILFPPGEEGTFEIPNFVSKLIGSSFYSSNLTSVYIPESITTLNGFVFGGSKLEKLNIQSKIIEGLIWWYVPLKEVTIGKNVTLIKNNAFIDNTKLETIKYEGTMDEWDKITKGDLWNNRCTNLKTISCTDGTITL